MCTRCGGDRQCHRSARPSAGGEVRGQFVQATAALGWKRERGGGGWRGAEKLLTDITSSHFHTRSSLKVFSSFPGECEEARTHTRSHTHIHSHTHSREQLPLQAGTVNHTGTALLFYFCQTTFFFFSRSFPGGSEHKTSQTSSMMHQDTRNFFFFQILFFLTCFLLVDVKCLQLFRNNKNSFSLAVNRMYMCVCVCVVLLQCVILNHHHRTLCLARPRLSLTTMTVTCCKSPPSQCASMHSAATDY